MHDPTTVFLTDIEAQQFLLFQKHRALFEHLEKAGVFDIQFGKCVLNFGFGQLQNVIKEEVVWKK